MLDTSQPQDWLDMILPTTTGVTSTSPHWNNLTCALHTLTLAYQPLHVTITDAQITMVVLKTTNTVPNLAIFSCVLCLTLNMSLHQISSNGISMIKEVFKLSAEALHVLMSCIFCRFHKRTESSFYDDVLQQLGSSRADDFKLCALGATENGLVTCEVSVIRKKVIHVMPALGPSLEDCPPKTEQVTD